MWRALIALLLLGSSQQLCAADWQSVDLAKLVDDDVQRHASDPTYFNGLSVSETRFSEAGFNWHLLRFRNIANPVGPLWIVPHDDENAAFDSAIAAAKAYGGVVVAVNSGAGGARMQIGQGTCGDRSARVVKCDPNRNFSDVTPVYTGAFVDQLASGHPIVALHTNRPGYGAGQGDVTILDAKAAIRGERKARKNGYFGRKLYANLADPDSFAIIPYRQQIPPPADVQCRNGLIDEGVNVWHEQVRKNDGSLSNYVALSMLLTRYVNMESRNETDLKLSSERHKLMIAAYLKRCGSSGDQPVSRP